MSLSVCVCVCVRAWVRACRVGRRFRALSREVFRTEAPASDVRLESGRSVSDQPTCREGLRAPRPSALSQRVGVAGRPERGRHRHWGHSSRNHAQWQRLLWEEGAFAPGPPDPPPRDWRHLLSSHHRCVVRRLRVLHSQGRNRSGSTDILPPLP